MAEKKPSKNELIEKGMVFWVGEVKAVGLKLTETNENTGVKTSVDLSSGIDWANSYIKFKSPLNITTNTAPVLTSDGTDGAIHYRIEIADSFINASDQTGTWECYAALKKDDGEIFFSQSLFFLVDQK